MQQRQARLSHGFSEIRCVGRHGAWCKQSNFESVARVPLLLHVPGISPSRSSALVEMVDLMPVSEAMALRLSQLLRV